MSDLGAVDGGTFVSLMALFEKSQEGRALAPDMCLRCWYKKTVETGLDGGWSNAVNLTATL